MSEDEKRGIVGRAVDKRKRAKAVAEERDRNPVARWEYKITWQAFDLAGKAGKGQNAEGLANGLGQRGWELVAVQGNSMFFKRQVVSEDESG